jgi:hypothetical protein
MANARQVTNTPAAEAEAAKKYNPAIDDLEAEVLRLDQQRAWRERQEEGLISEAEEKDVAIQRRPQASPWAVLAIAELVGGGIQAA